MGWRPSYHNQRAGLFGSHVMKPDKEPAEMTAEDWEYVREREEAARRAYRLSDKAQTALAEAIAAAVGVSEGDWVSLRGLANWLAADAALATSVPDLYRIYAEWEQPISADAEAALDRQEMGLSVVRKLMGTDSTAPVSVRDVLRVFSDTAVAVAQAEKAWAASRPEDAGHARGFGAAECLPATPLQKRADFVECHRPGGLLGRSYLPTRFGAAEAPDYPGQILPRPAVPGEYLYKATTRPNFLCGLNTAGKAVWWVLLPKAPKRPIGAAVKWLEWRQEYHHPTRAEARVFLAWAEVQVDQSHEALVASCQDPELLLWLAEEVGYPGYKAWDAIAPAIARASEKPEIRRSHDRAYWVVKGLAHSESERTRIADEIRAALPTLAQKWDSAIKAWADTAMQAQQRRHH